MSAAATARYRASAKGRATAAAYERGEQQRAYRQAWSRSNRGRASRWLAKHKMRYGDARPDRCPYTGHARIALHMNSRTLQIEGWVSSQINWNVLPWMGGSLVTFRELNPEAKP